MEGRIGSHFQRIAQTSRITDTQRVGDDRGTRYIQQRTHIQGSGDTSDSRNIQLMRSGESSPRLIHGNLSTDGLKASRHRNQCGIIARGIRKVGSHNDLARTDIRASIANHGQKSAADIDATPTHIDRYGIRSGSKR